MSTNLHGPEWLQFLLKRLGTKWVIARGLTRRLRAKGYTLAVSPKQFEKLKKEFLSIP